MKKVTLNFCGYFYEVAVSKISPDSESIVETVDRDELEEFVNNMEFGVFNDWFGNLDEDSKCFDIKFDDYKYYAIADMSDMNVYIGDSEKPIEGIDNNKIYPFLICDIKTDKLVAHLPKIGIENCGKDYNEQVVKIMNERNSDNILDDSLYGEMTFINLPDGMVLVEFYRNRGCYSAEIELEDDEEFEPSKLFFAGFDDYDEYAVIGQYNAVPLNAIIYNNKWFPTVSGFSEGKFQTKFLTRDFKVWNKTICGGEDYD